MQWESQSYFYTGHLWNFKKKKVSQNTLDRIPKWLKNPGRWLEKKTNIQNDPKRGHLACDLVVWAFGMTTNSCYYAGVWGSGIPFFKLDTDPWNLYFWFPGCPNNPFLLLITPPINKPKNFWRENGCRKEEELILPSKVHKCRFWNRNLWKEKERKKVGIREPASKVLSPNAVLGQLAAQNYR